MKEYTLRRSTRAGQFSGLFHRTYVHLFDDHLAILKNVGYTMEIKRYFLTDILSFVAARSRFYLVAPFFWIGMGLAWVFILSNKWGTLVGVLGLAWEMAFGPRATLEIRTPHSVEKFTHVSRLRSMRKLIETVSRKIQDVQGPLPARDQAPAEFEHVTYTGSDPVRPAVSGIRSADLLKPGYTWLYLTLWTMILPNFGLGIFGFIFPKIFAVAPVVFSLSMIGMIYVVITLNRFPTVTGLMKGIGWYGSISVIVTLAVCVGFYYKSLLEMTFKRSGALLSNFDILIHMTKSESFPFFMHALSFNLLFASLLCGSAVSRAISLLEKQDPSSV